MYINYIFIFHFSSLATLL